MGEPGVFIRRVQVHDRADDRLMDTTQTVRERSRNIIRSLQEHDSPTSLYITFRSKLNCIICATI
jgi:hypothetical protein